jgi:hypothetical protein
MSIKEKKEEEMFQKVDDLMDDWKEIREEVRRQGIPVSGDHEQVIATMFLASAVRDVAKQLEGLRSDINEGVLTYS